MDGLEKMYRDELRSIVSKLNVLKYNELQKLKKKELIDVIKFKEIFPFEDSYFSNENKNIKIVKKRSKEVKYQIYPRIKTDECSICLNNIKYEKMILPCNHNFHYICIIMWFTENPICPICRLEYKKKFTRNGWTWVNK